MINWRGASYYLAKSVRGPHEWRTHLREVRLGDMRPLAAKYLERLLRHATERVPYYRSLGLAGRPLSDFPIVEKPDVRRNPNQYQTIGPADHHWHSSVTSGSTGELLEIVQDRGADAWVEASDAWYYSELLGASRRAWLSGPRVFIWHRHQDPKKTPSVTNRLARSIAPVSWLEPCEALSERKLLDYARAIGRVRPAFIVSYAGVLYEIARTALGKGVRLHRPRFIISGAETLHPFMRQVVEEAFGCRVYDYYGSSEAGRVAGECSAGNLHVFEFSCHAEVLDPAGKPALPGEEGRLILTPLHNYAMPLIRYDSSDVAQVGPYECPCGCPLPTLKRIAGRTVEFFATREGNLLSGAGIVRLMANCRWILGFQALQREIDRMTIFYKRTDDSPASREDIRRVNAGIADLMGAQCQIEWVETEEIPCTPNGKRPYARSLVWEDRQPFSLWKPS